MRFTPTVYAMAVAVLAPISSAWNLNLWATQNSCGGDYAPDTSEGGTPKTNSGCRFLPITGLNAINFTDWDTGCRFATFWSYDCKPESSLGDYIKEEQEIVNDNWVCINNLAETRPGLAAVEYICE